jgi:hypothetical protein
MLQGTYAWNQPWSVLRSHSGHGVRKVDQYHWTSGVQRVAVADKQTHQFSLPPKVIFWGEKARIELGHLWQLAAGKSSCK